MISGKEYYLQLMSVANEAHKNGDIKKAKVLYTQLTRDMPKAPEPFHMLAVIASSDQKYDQAIPLYEKAIERMPMNAVYRTNLAEVFQRTNRFDEAIELLKSAIRYDEKFNLARLKLASVYSRTGKFQDSEKQLLETLNEDQNYVPGLQALGTLYLKMGVLERASELLQKVTELDPRLIDAWNNLGAVFQEQEVYERALECYKTAENLDPKRHEAITNLARLYALMGNQVLSKEYYLKLAGLNADNPILAWKASSICPSVFGSGEEVASYRADLIRGLNDLKKKKIHLVVEQLDALHLHPPTDTIYHGLDQLSLYREFDDLFKKIPEAGISNQLNDKFKLGIVLSPGHEGVFLRSMKGILNHMSTDEIDITLVCFGLRTEKIIKPEITNQKIRIISFSEKLEWAIRQVAGENFDLMYYWEVGTDALNYFLPYFRPASIQCTSWGWPVTSGNSKMDYYISSKGLETEESEGQYCEKLILFNRLPTFYYKPDISPLQKGLSDFGFNKEENLYFCNQNLKKVHPDFDLILKGILEKDGKARIIFREDRFTWITDQLKQRFEKLGDYSDRITFLPWLSKEDYHQLLQLTDVMLDTQYHNGVNTTYDALAAGTPIVTLQGRFLRDRYTLACYRQMGMEGPVAETKEDYVDIAVQVANSEPYRKDLNSEILAKNQELFEDWEAVKEFEGFVENVARKA